MGGKRKITFLGTSHGFAEKGHFTSGTLIEASGYSYLIDAGAPVEGLLLNYEKDISSIRGVFITHMHSDHAGDLAGIISGFMREDCNDKVKCYMPEKAGLDAFIAWMKALYTNVEAMQKLIRFQVIFEGIIFDECDMKVTAIPTKHMGRGKYPSFAFMLEHKGKRILFTGEMVYGFQEYESIIADREYDLVVCEMAHAKLEEVWERLARTKTKKMIINHTWPPCLEHCEEIFGKMPFDVQVAQDGMELWVC